MKGYVIAVYIRLSMEDMDLHRAGERGESSRDTEPLSI